ncbi:MAG: hypothetical protein ACI9U2_003551 [Bradymonadia bacterium]|jgi:hypothetical protein
MPMRLLMMALCCVVGISVTGLSPAVAQEACDDVVEVDRDRYLRQLTLDLWGRVPSMDELRAFSDVEAISEDHVQAMLDDDAGFQQLVRRHHADLLWPSTEGIDIIGGAIALLLPARLYDQFGDGSRLFNVFVGLFTRNGVVPCLDEPAEWDADGALVFFDQPDGTRREGYVMMAPYWAPNIEVKVCAAETRLNETNAAGEACDTATGMGSGECGCGPALRHCADFSTVQTMTQMLQEQQLRMAEAPIFEGRPYTDMLLEKSEEVNGPLVHYYRYLTQMGADPFIQYPPVAADALPDIPYDDVEWQTVARTAPQHAGILTSMSYLLRFQTSRARANQFYNAFLCQPFVAPPDGLPSPNDACSQEPNLRNRCGCQFCHAQLEPSAGHWARFADAGTAWLDPEIFPTYLARCANCARRGDNCDFICNRFYVSEIGHPDAMPYVGVLKAYQWRDEGEISKVEAGPGALVQRAINDGRIARCASTKLFERLYKRAPTAVERREQIARFAEVFEASNYDFKTLVKAMVMDPAYRRMVR